MDYTLKIMNQLTQQLEFVREIDKLKGVLRRSFLLDGSRAENSAEHSWHLALMALTLAEHANEAIDVGHVVKMVLIHDIVEIDAGDTFLYDQTGNASKAEREQQAAARIFGLLPAAQRDELIALWQEFEGRETADSHFANALDRFIPLLHNYDNQGKAWRENNVTRDRVIQMAGHMDKGSSTLWNYALNLIDDAVEKGYLAP